MWLSEVKANAGKSYDCNAFFCIVYLALTCVLKPCKAVDADPERDARTERKSRVAKNERQQLQNAARAAEAAAGKVTRKTEIERTLATTRSSTASMGKFDKKLEGEKKLRGVKRKVNSRPLASIAMFSHF